jgi:DNA-binding XRE family transcriptional regulator
MIPTATQCRAARALLDISQAALAKRSGVSKRAISYFEKEQKQLNEINRQSVREFFEREGVLFIGDTGVMLSPEKHKKPRK